MELSVLGLLLCVLATPSHGFGILPNQNVGVGVVAVVGVGTTRVGGPSQSRLPLCMSNSKWDDLVDEDELPLQAVPPDMMYIARNVARQNCNFCDIRDAGGVDMTQDVYVRDPKNTEVFWFVGKVARISDVTPAQCVARQYALIEQHAANLRPLELSPQRGYLEIWIAPGDSELQVAYNKPDLIMEQIPRNVEGAAKVNKNYVGFQGEIYDAGDEGFRTWRTNDGKAAKPEVNPAKSEQVASQEELDRLLKTMDGMDINELYKQQEQREGRAVDEE